MLLVPARDVIIIRLLVKGRDSQSSMERLTISNTCYNPLKKYMNLCSSLYVVYASYSSTKVYMLH